MKRLLLLALLTVVACEGAEPKARPRLAPGVAGDADVRPAGKSEARSDRDAASQASDGSFESYLQARSRRPAGLEAVPAVAASRSQKTGAEKPAAAAKESSPGPARLDSTGAADVLVLPKMEVTAETMTKLRVQLAELEARQAQEERLAAKAAESSVLDSILNPPWLRLRGYSGQASAALARKRIKVLDWVKLLTFSLEEAKTPEEKKRIQADIDGLNEIMRHWR
jgi:hypothetical protein